MMILQHNQDELQIPQVYATGILCGCSFQFCQGIIYEYVFSELRHKSAPFRQLCLHLQQNVTLHYMVLSIEVNSVFINLL